MKKRLFTPEEIWAAIGRAVENERQEREKEDPTPGSKSTKGQPRGVV